MTIPVKDITQVTQKWQDNAGRAGGTYQTNAVAAASRWASNTSASKNNFQQGISAPGVADRFASGVQKAGAAKYARKVGDVGQSRYSNGITAGVTDFTNGVQPVLQTIAGLTLDPRKPRGDPSNINRVSQVANALHAKRIAGLGGKA